MSFSLVSSASAVLARRAYCDGESSFPTKALVDPTGGTIHLYQIAHLSKLGFPSAGKRNTSFKDGMRKSSSGQSYNKIIREDDCVIMDCVRSAGKKITVNALPRAGPRDELHFDPTEVRAAIVTCGGLCPGLNDVVYHIFNTLTNSYGVSTIYGIRGGYRGLSRGPEVIRTSSAETGIVGSLLSLFGYNVQVKGSDKQSEDHFRPVLLTPQYVDGIQHNGGTMLGSSRGGFDLEKTLEFVMANNINQLYIVGGDGTHRGAHKISRACIERGLNVSVACIPKTIDNDIAIIDNSFGFQSAVEAAQLALTTAKTEASCNMPNGVGVVKLMGRSAGYIAAYASLSSGDADLVLLPEIPLVLDGDKGFLPHIERVVAKQGHAVVVVAEGAGEDVLGQSAEVDAGGNRKLPAVGDFVVDKIKKHFKDSGKPVTVKYIDPSYIIRSVPANSRDSYECFVLSQGAVHGAMAGYTGFTVGMVNSHTAMIPADLLAERSPRTMNPKGRTMERLLAMTGQPDVLNN